MTQDEKWQRQYEQMMTFMETYHRRPSKHRLEEHDMLNWLKATRKRMNANGLKPERVEAFNKLMVLIEQYKRKNQWV